LGSSVTGSDTGVRVGPVMEADVERVAQLAAEVWRHHYPAIISAAQIEYMLQQRYDAALIRAELERRDVWWDKLEVGNTMVAFGSCFLADGPTMKLDKLYVHPAHQRKGYGGLLIGDVCDRARKQGCSQVVLAVNKNNRSAIAAYLKHGFTVLESVVKDIGGGFVMDDYVMVRRV
jgi:ribosomal protein S18 acetylase RimI-like enzyme